MKYYSSNVTSSSSIGCIIDNNSSSLVPCKHNALMSKAIKTIGEHQAPFSSLSVECRTLSS